MMDRGIGRSATFGCPSLKTPVFIGENKNARSVRTVLTVAAAAAALDAGPGGRRNRFFFWSTVRPVGRHRRRGGSSPFRHGIEPARIITDNSRYG